jgi:methyl-accepting chemotaxis protein
MDQITQQNAAMVEESTASSHTLAREAQKLAAHVARFDVGAQQPAANAPIPFKADRKKAQRPAARQAAPVERRKVANGGFEPAATPARGSAAADSWEEF